MAITIGKRHLLAAAAVLGLAATGIAVPAAVAAAKAPAAPAQVSLQAPVGVDAVAPGTGTLFFDWGCDGSYSSTGITFNAAGTFNTTDGLAGIWVNSGGFLLFTFNAPSETTYASVVASRASAGSQTTFSGLNGCHHVVQAGIAAFGTNADSRSADGSFKKS